eukprot:scaffold24542_cov166-Cylindrotheca_fusiformis.AAC.1
MKRIPKTGRVKSIPGGNTSHSPPEIFYEDGYDAKALDMWVLAVLLFEVLTGHCLYEIPSRYDLSYQYFIYAGGLTTKKPNSRLLEEAHMFREVSYLENTFVRRMSPELKDLFENTLCVKPSSRWSIEKVLDSSWMKESNPLD